MRMWGRARLSTDYSETRIKLKFDPDYPVPNIPASCNVCPTDPMLVAVIKPRFSRCFAVCAPLGWA
jgi:hypothetical protein